MLPGVAVIFSRVRNSELPFCLTTSAAFDSASGFGSGVSCARPIFATDMVEIENLLIHHDAFICLSRVSSPSIYPRNDRPISYHRVDNQPNV